MNFTFTSVTNKVAFQSGHDYAPAFDIVHILRKARQQVTDCVADLSAEHADTDPNIFTKIHVHFTVTGKALDPKRVEQAVKLSAEKYCSASIMLGKTAAITHDFEIVEN